MPKKENINEEDKTYSGEGMLYGVTAGIVIGNIIMMIIGYDKIMYLPICVSVRMCIGLAIGSSIKKDKQNKNKAK